MFKRFTIPQNPETMCQMAQMQSIQARKDHLDDVLDGLSEALVLLGFGCGVGEWAREDNEQLDVLFNAYDVITFQHEEARVKLDTLIEALEERAEV